MKPFDPKAVKLLSACDAPGILYTTCLDEPARTLYGAGTDGAVHAVDLSASKPAAVKRWAIHDNYVSAIVLGPSGLISAGYDRRLVWTDREGKRIRAVEAHDGWVRRLLPTPDGKRLVTAGDDMLVKVWDADGKPLASLAGHAKRTPEGYLSALYALAVSPDGNQAASGDRAGFIRVWDLATGKTTAEFRSTELYTFDPVKRLRAIGGVRGLCFSADGTGLAVSGIGPVTNVDGFVGPCRMEWWDWKAGKRLAVGQDKHQAILNQVTVAPDGWLIAAGGGDGGGALAFWNPGQPAGPAVSKPKGHLQAFVLDRAATRLHAVSHGGFQVWQIREA